MRSTPARPHHQRWTLVLVCAAVFMLLLDLTVVAVALGSIQRDLNADLADLEWVVDAYTLPLAGLLLTAATLADRLGRRRVFLAGMTVFTLGSLGCALSWSALGLDVARAVQGAGGAMLFGTALPLLAAAFPGPRERATAIGAFGATLAGATAVGPLVGGALVDGPGWRWIFLVNLPIGVLAVVAGLRRLQESRAARPRPVDVAGTVLLSAGLLALLLALIRGNVDGWGSARIVLLLVAAAVLLAGFLAREATARAPMLDLTLFRSLPFTGVAVAVFTVSGTLIAATTYLALFVQNTLGYGPLASGLRFLPLTAASFVAAPVAARLARRVPSWVLVSGGLALAGVGLLLSARLDADSGWLVLVPGFVVAGVGMGIGTAATTGAATSAVEVDRAGMATGAINTVRQVGIAAGVAAIGAAFQHRATDAMHDRLAGSGLPGRAVAALGDAVGSGAGARVAAAVPVQVREVVATAARGATATAMDGVLTGAGLIAVAAAVAAALLVRLPRPAVPGAVPQDTDPARGEGGTRDAVAAPR